MDLGEIGSGGVEWIYLAQDRDRWRALVNAVMNLRLLAPRSNSNNILVHEQYGLRKVLSITNPLMKYYMNSVIKVMFQ
jgi:hypothetical protein